MLAPFATTFLNYAKTQNEESGSDLAKVSPGDGDSVGCIGEMQPGSDVNGTTRTTGFNTRLVRGVIALYTQKHTNAKEFCKLSDRLTNQIIYFFLSICGNEGLRYNLKRQISSCALHCELCSHLLNYRTSCKWMLDYSYSVYVLYMWLYFCVLIYSCVFKL